MGEVTVKERGEEQRVEAFPETQNVKHKRHHLETKERKGRKWDNEREKEKSGRGRNKK